MQTPKPSPGNFYIDAVRGRKSAESFNALICLYSLLQRKMDDYFKPYDLTPVQFNALLLIRHLGGEEGLSQNDICHHLIVSPSNITRLMNRMIENGLVKRVVFEKDRRVHLIRITPKGIKLLDETWHGYGEMIQQSVYVLERKDVEQLSELLLKWFFKLDASMQGGRDESSPEKS